MEQMARLDKNGRLKSPKQTGKVKLYVKQLFITILGSKYLAANCDAVAERYGIDKDLFSDATIDLYELMVMGL